MNTRSYGLKSWFVAGTILLVLVAGTLFSFSKAFAIDYWSPVKAFFTGAEVYVNLVEDEITELETELSIVESKLASGQMTAEEAEAARSSIIDRMDRINKSVANTNTKGLSPETLAKFRVAVVRLRNVLIDYRDSLVVLDEIIETAEVSSSGSQNVSKSKHRGGRSLVTFVTETTENVSTFVENAETEIEDFDEIATETQGEEVDLSDEETSNETETQNDAQDEFGDTESSEDDSYDGSETTETGNVEEMTETENTEETYQEETSKTGETEDATL